MARSKRFQDCSWPVRAWRLLRWYPTIPFHAVRMWAWGEEHAWSIAKGLAQAKMHWYYTMEEL